MADRQRLFEMTIKENKKMVVYRGLVAVDGSYRIERKLLVAKNWNPVYWSNNSRQIFEKRDELASKDENKK